MKPFRTLYAFIVNVAQLLVLIGALNWGLIGYNKTDAVVLIFPRNMVRTVHLAVGLAALFLILQRFL